MHDEHPTIPATPIAALLPLLDALADGPDSHDHVIAAIGEAQLMIGERNAITEEEAIDISIRLGCDARTRQPMLEAEDIQRLAFHANAKPANQLRIIDDPIGRSLASDDQLAEEALAQIRAVLAA
ncbi:protein of unknown function (plasmid) [Magnetospirillum sp. XM-1]|uniref:hypothetical protein n=1 Tax=Magnetospirillum sp. XM-1 TaxID=1663591 RepID=UPI00073E0E75|nr:hypothetical protein [Magnetospirillum sp. XM-1]CUW41879.1 protein of unknown function [Magnetospirillum sp. XM-1]